jgi:WD40 repeat protein
MAEEVYRYRAFISYRHVERDRKWARWLIDKLETYRTPRLLVLHGAPLRIGYLFRDDDEIPAASDLSHQIEDALSASQFLIVVCSRDTPQSKWVRREIEFFRSLGRGNRILALLVDGEPEQAFPPELLHVPRERIAPDGTKTVELVDAEPIAADVRQRRDERKGTTERRAFLRIAAGLLGVAFDDLARRDHQRRVRRQRFVAGAASLAITGIALASYIAISDIEKANQATRVSQNLSAAQAALSNANIEAAVQSAASAYAIDPSSETRSVLYLALSRLSPNLVQRVSLGSQAVKALAWSKDGVLAIATSTGAAYSVIPGRSANPLTPLVKPPASPSGAIAISFAPNGALVALFANGVLAASAPRSQTWQSAPVTTAAVYGAAFDDDNDQLVVVPIAESPVLLHCEGAIAKPGSRCVFTRFAASYGSAVSVNSKSGEIAIGDHGGNVAIYARGATQPSLHFSVGAAVISLSWDQKNDWLAAGLANGTVLVEDVQSRSQRGSYSSGEAVISAVAFSPASDLLAFSCRARAVCVADAGLVQANPHLLVLKGHSNVVTHLAWSSDGERLASSDEDNAILVWNLEPSHDVFFDAEPFGPSNIAALATSPEADRLAVARGDGSVSVWDTKALVSQLPHARYQIANLAGLHGEEQAAIAWGPKGALAVEYPDMLRLWPDGIDKLGVDGPIVELSARIAWTRDGRHVALPLSNGRVALVDARQPTPDNTQYLPPPGASISAWSVVAPPKGPQLLVSYSGGRIVQWNSDTGHIIAHMPLPRADRIAPIGLSVNADGSLLATTGGDRFIKLYDLTRNVALPSLETDASETAGGVAFSPDGALLAATGADNRIYVWEMGDGSRKRFLKIEPGSVSDNDNWASEGFSGAIAWISPRTLAVLRPDGTVRAFNLDEGHWRARARALNLNYGAVPD